MSMAKVAAQHSASVPAGRDLEAAHSLFDNNSVASISWSGVTVTVRDRATHAPLDILSTSEGHLEAGQMLALMGPSGSGKTTLLNVLAGRSQVAHHGSVMVNGAEWKETMIRHVSSYVEQEDTLTGSLTVSETVDFTARLGASMPSKTRQSIVAEIVRELGLQGQQNTLVGTPLKKGISGGQKRRLSVATKLLTAPKLLFLDEPTSGLDSVASFEVMKFIASLAQKHRIIVIASIHQPSTSGFNLFDKVLLLSQGCTCYYGPSATIVDYFSGFAPIPPQMNPAEYLLELVNTDFSRTEKDHDRVERISTVWATSEQRAHLQQTITHGPQRRSPNTISAEGKNGGIIGYGQPGALSTTVTLLHRSFLKSYRDPLAYHTRILMYTGLAILMGTVFLRLPYTQSSIQPFINAIFFGGAFMSFMAVAYIPAIGEDIAMLSKEFKSGGGGGGGGPNLGSQGGLYNAAHLTIANFVVGMPWLFGITLLFSIISYWLSNFTPTASAFWLWVCYLFLDLLAAESLVVLVTALSPNFVLALAVTAFANGLWMAVGGFLVPLGSLNVFWKYVFHYIDYQAYVFQGMMVNQFANTVYACDRADGSDGFQCMYPSALLAEGQIQGTTVLDAYHYSHRAGIHGLWIGIMIAIIVAYRVLGYFALEWRARRH